MWYSFMMLPPENPPMPDYDKLLRGDFVAVPVGPTPEERQQKALEEASKLADEYLKNKS